MRTILKTALNTANRIEAINTLVMLVVQYSVNVINWTLQDFRRIDAKIRQLFTCYKMHHPNADKDWLYLPRSEGDRSLIQTELTDKATTIGRHKYLQTKKDWMMELVRKHENSKKTLLIPQRRSEVYERVKHWRTRRIRPRTNANKSCEKNETESKVKKFKELTWEEKALYGNYPLRASNVSWVCSSGLKAEAEEFNLTA